MTTLRLSSIVWDPTIYPRQRWNTGTIERYVDAMEAGDVFPPLTLEKDTQRLLDGKHRLEAYKKLHGDLFSSVEVAVEYHVVPETMTARYYAGTLSAKHGDRLSNADIKDIAEYEFEADPTIDPKEWGEGLGISKSTVYSWVSHILERERVSRASKAWRLSRLGWTQKEIAARLEVTQGLISGDIKNSRTGKINEILGLHWNEKGIDEEAIRLNVPLIDCYASALTDLSDMERLKRLNITLQPYDVWHWNDCHDLFGATYPGRIPGQLVAHVLYFYTEPGALVIDPMAGSGTTVDVCLAMNRKCYAYDMDEAIDRPDILTHNLATQGWPAHTKQADLIFWDPPYFKKKEGEYVAGGLSDSNRNEYLLFFTKCFKEASALVKPGTRLAFLMSDWDADENPKEMLGIWHYAWLLEQAGWALQRHIMAPLSTQQIHPDIVTKFRVSKRLARLGRSLLVAVKP